MYAFKFIKKNITNSLIVAVASLPIQAFASSTVINSNDQFPLDTVAFVPCGNFGMGEDVHFTGTFHITTHSVVSSANHINSNLHINAQNIKGTGLTTGYQFQHSNSANVSMNYDGDDGLPFVSSLINGLRFIGQGSGNNFLIHANTQVVVNANGDVTANVVNENVECQ